MKWIRGWSWMEAIKKARGNSGFLSVCVNFIRHHRAHGGSLLVPLRFGSRHSAPEASSASRLFFFCRMRLWIIGYLAAPHNNSFRSACRQRFSYASASVAMYFCAEASLVSAPVSCRHGLHNSHPASRSVRVHRRCRCQSCPPTISRMM